MWISPKTEIYHFVHHEPRWWVHNRDHKCFSFSKPLIERTPKISLKRHPFPQNHPLVVLCKENRSPSQYQVKGKYQMHFTKKSKIPILFIAYSLSRLVFRAKNYAALLTESFHMSMSYWLSCSLQIAIQPLPRKFYKFFFATRPSIWFYTSAI